jgi:hypothetical protein
MKKIVFMICSLLLMSACSSEKSKAPVEERPVQDVKNTTIKREYEVRDASSDFRPGWIEDAEVWAKQNEKNLDKNRFFSHETEPKVTRGVACDFAKANLNADIASEITTFIEKTFASYTDGNASVDLNNPKVSELKEYMSNTLAQKVQSMVHGAAIVKTYWEQREYKKSLGAKEDFKAFTCAVLIRMDSERLKKAVDEAANFVMKKAEDKESKAKVEEALKNVSDNFIKARKGEI